MSASLQIDAVLVEATIGTSETTVAHDLGRAPVEAFVIRKGFSGSIFRGATAWTATNIFLQASGETLVRLMIF